MESLDKFFVVIKRIFSDIYRDRAPLSTDLKYDNAVRSLASQHLLYMGDIFKFKARTLQDEEKGAGTRSQEIKSMLEQSWNFYNRAKTLYPFDGKIYNSFAAFCQKENDYLATVTYLMRALACDMPHEASKEFLITYFEELRLKYIDLNKKKEKNNMKCLRFLLAFFRVQNILYTRVGIDQLSTVQEQ